MLRLTSLVLYLALVDVAKPDSCSSWYRIQSGDYCYKIWTDNGLTEQQLLALNPGLNCNALNIGDSVCLAERAGLPTCTAWHAVQSGEYCYLIRTQYQLSERQFNELNPNLDCNALQ
ncbi:LysM domain protein, partial [Ancylostoma caninum]